MANLIELELRRQQGEMAEHTDGPIAGIAASYHLESNRLLGLLLKFDFEESLFVTCDAWKRACGGVPRGSFVLFRIDPRAVNPEDREFCNRLILARITSSAPTPVETDIQLTLFQVHKLQAQLDPLTHQDLQWGALKASIIGTFYDDGDTAEGGDGKQIAFGNDVDTFLSPFAYVAYMPTNEHLAALINSFVTCDKPLTIGTLRYTETPSPGSVVQVPILVDPRDIVGEPTKAQRLANFGKTRFGKSNSNKIIAQAVFESGLDVAQVFFDPSGEYTYVTDQDKTSLYSQYHDRSVRYSLSSRSLRQDEKQLGLEAPKLLKIDFYTHAGVGHSLIQSLWDTENQSLPGYMRPVLDWLPEDLRLAPESTDHSAYNHYWRTMGLWFALLKKADFEPPSELRVPINFRDEVKKVLVQDVPGVAKEGDRFSAKGQPIAVLPELYRVVARLWAEHSNNKNWFPPSTDGTPYFNDIEDKLLKMLAGTSGWTAHNYIRPFRKYHSVEGSSIFDDIVEYVSNGTSVFVDMTQSNDAVRQNLVDRICRRIYGEQNRRFSSDEGIGHRFVMFYFEEAHRLFSKDDSNLPNNIYNLLAKEGAKLNIAMVYATQSMTTISPDLIKNTDNFLIAHLDDDREAREVARKYAFRDIADDVQRVQSRGFVRMITRSHRFALPVQIRLFGADSSADSSE